jgi:hypothetical protein
VCRAQFAATGRAFFDVPAPLPADAPAHLFSEGRAMASVVQLAETIGHRQVSSPGEEAAATWLLEQAAAIARYAAEHRPDLEVEAAREQATGAIGRQSAFKFDIANV